MPQLAASKRKDYIRYWFVTVDPNVPRRKNGETDPVKIAEFIESVLDDHRGWSRFGYTFQRISAEEGLVSREDPSMWKYVFHIRLSLPDTILKNCLFGDLNCADLMDNVVYIHNDLWMNGSEKSGMYLQEYRIYVVNHEIAHLLNRGHHKCSKEPRELCPVMYQQSISKGCCTPNPWPLDWE